MTFLQIILYPLTLIYRLLTDFRNHLYNIGSRKSFEFEVFVINVGNLTVGGTGKTPHVEYLIRLLKKQFPLATLSRGYGRKTKGFILADDSASAHTIGDEPMQFYRKFASEISVAVGEERAFAIPHILFERPETQLIVLDDAFQHRAVRPQFNILLTDYNRLFYKDFPFPSGRLRESRYGAQRADVVVVSKCPNDLSEQEKKEIAHEIQKYTRPETSIFFTGVRYGEIEKAFSQDKKYLETFTEKTAVVLFSGIARSEGLENYLKTQFEQVIHFKFADHYRYQPKDIEKIIQAWQQISASSKLIITTEKDYVKLLSGEFRVLFQDIPLFFLPIEVYFLAEEEKFKNLIIAQLKNFYSK